MELEPPGVGWAGSVFACMFGAQQAWRAWVGVGRKEQVRLRVQEEGSARVSASPGDGAFRDPVGCCAHSTCGICCGLCIWHEHCCVLAAALVGAVRGRGCGGFTSLLMGIPSFTSICCPTYPMPSLCLHQLHPWSPPKRTGGRNGGQPCRGNTGTHTSWPWAARTQGRL